MLSRFTQRQYYKTERKKQRQDKDAGRQLDIYRISRGVRKNRRSYREAIFQRHHLDLGLWEERPNKRITERRFHDAEQGPIGLRGQRWPLPAHGHLHARLLRRRPKDPVRDPRWRKAGREESAVPEVSPARFVLARLIVILRVYVLTNFPSAAGIANAVMIFVTFVVTIPGIITPARKWLKLGGFMAAVCAFFSLIVGLYLWILTLKTKEEFAPIYAQQTEEVQKLMQTAVSISSITFLSGSLLCADFELWYSSTAVGTLTARRLLSGQTPCVLAQQLQPSCAGVRHPSRPLLTFSSTIFSPPSLDLLVSMLSWSCLPRACWRTARSESDSAISTARPTRSADSKGHTRFVLIDAFWRGPPGCFNFDTPPPSIWTCFRYGQRSKCLLQLSILDLFSRYFDGLRSLNMPAFLRFILSQQSIYIPPLRVYSRVIGMRGVFDEQVGFGVVLVFTFCLVYIHILFLHILSTHPSIYRSIPCHTDLVIPIAWPDGFY